MKTEIDRFNESFEILENGCWKWKKYIAKNGYGKAFHDGSKKLAHRVSYELFIGKIPEGKFVLHSCDNRWCVCPNHLHIGTAADNTREMMERGRAVFAYGSKNGNYTHPEKYHHPKGQDHPSAKLNDAKVFEIRDMWKTGKYTLKQIGDKYGVSDSAINFIVRNHNWKHI